MSSLKECIECQQKHGVNIDWCLACVKRKQSSIHIIGEVLEVSPKENRGFGHWREKRIVAKNDDRWEVERSE
jgi:hypothetical protein